VDVGPPQMVFGAGPARPRSTGDGPVWIPPFSARTWLESTTQRDQSSRDTALSPASSASSSRCQTPDSFQSVVVSNRSCPTRSSSRWAGTPTECRCAARTGCRGEPSEPARACAPDTGTAAACTGAAVRSASTAHPTRSMVSPHVIRMLSPLRTPQPGPRRLTALTVVSWNAASPVKGNGAVADLPATSR
jgi:hypothetical protein